MPIQLPGVCLHCPRRPLPQPRQPLHPLQPHGRRRRESVRAPETPAPRRARSAKAVSSAVRAAHSVRASRSTIRRTPSKSRNQARARYSDPPGDLDTDTSPHSPGLSRRRGIAKPPAESSGPARRTRPTREIEGACQAESLADHSLASASHKSSAPEHSERGDIRCRPQRVMPGAHRPPPPTPPASPIRRIAQCSPQQVPPPRSRL